MYVTYLITSIAVFAILVSLLTLIKKTTLLSKYLSTRRLTVRAMSIPETSWQLLANSPSFLPLRGALKITSSQSTSQISPRIPTISESTFTTVYCFLSDFCFFTLDHFKRFIYESMTLSDIEWSASQFRVIKYITLGIVIEKKVYTTSAI